MRTPLRVSLGSVSSAKRAGLARAGYGHHRPIEIHQIPVESEVSEQPMSLGETALGAWNRAKAAMRIDIESDVGLGIEGGVFQLSEELVHCGFVAGVSRRGNAMIAPTAWFKLGASIKELSACGTVGRWLEAIGVEGNDELDQGMSALVGEGFRRSEYFTDACRFVLASIDPSISRTALPVKGIDKFVDQLRRRG